MNAATPPSRRIFSPWSSRSRGCQMLLEASNSGARSIGIFGLTPHFVKVFTIMVGVAKYATISPNEAAAVSAL